MLEVLIMVVCCLQGVWSEVYGLPLGTAVAAAAAGGSEGSGEQEQQQ
jgi:hypothetical protein